MSRTVLAIAPWLLGAVALAGVGVLPGTAREASAQAEVSVDVFDDTLSPYGTWVTVDGVGRAWRPNVEVVGDEFQPYASGGHWVYTDYGWSFESDWDWGWAPFHYGRWYDDRRQGWVWVAGRTWGPAWVDWRSGGGYVGWVPMAPAGVRVTYVNSPRQWSFVPEARFTDHRIWDHRVPREQVQGAYSGSVAVNSHRTWGGTRFNAGPPPQRIAAATGRPVAPVRFTPPRRGEVTTVRVTANGVERHAPPRVHAAPAQRPSPAIRPVPAQRPAPAIRTVPARRPPPAPQERPAIRQQAPTHPAPARPQRQPGSAQPTRPDPRPGPARPAASPPAHSAHDQRSH